MRSGSWSRPTSCLPATGDEEIAEACLKDTRKTQKSSGSPQFERRVLGHVQSPPQCLEGEDFGRLTGLISFQAARCCGCYAGYSA